MRFWKTMSIRVGPLVPRHVAGAIPAAAGQGVTGPATQFPRPVSIRGQLVRR